MLLRYGLHNRWVSLHSGDALSDRGQAWADNETQGRPSQLAEAILRISKGLDLDVVLQEVVDGAAR